jgi:hypothetical protein
MIDFTGVERDDANHSPLRHIHGRSISSRSMQRCGRVGNLGQLDGDYRERSALPICTFAERDKRILLGLHFCWEGCATYAGVILHKQIFKNQENFLDGISRESVLSICRPRQLEGRIFFITDEEDVAPMLMLSSRLPLPNLHHFSEEKRKWMKEEYIVFLVLLRSASTFL